MFLTKLCNRLLFFGGKRRHCRIPTYGFAHLTHHPQIHDTIARTEKIPVSTHILICLPLPERVLRKLRAPSSTPRLIFLHRKPISRLFFLFTGYVLRTLEK